MSIFPSNGEKNISPCATNVEHIFFVAGKEFRLESLHWSSSQLSLWKTPNLFFLTNSTMAQLLSWPSIRLILIKERPPGPMAVAPRRRCPTSPARASLSHKDRGNFEILDFLKVTYI